VRGATWLFRLAAAIRVQYSRYRDEAPELKNAIVALDRGGCVMMFPEGHLRHYENRPLSSFGQGVWHILAERPSTPVVVCWIEGGWGSFFSYWRGKPTKNKWPDFWRSIRVAVSEPIVLDGELLRDRRATRLYLMQRCLDARKFLALTPHPMPSHLLAQEPVGAASGPEAMPDDGDESK
jgi:1-acyl-sn-glycerol-3-phosphate acyltransferase